MSKKNTLRTQAIEELTPLTLFPLPNTLTPELKKVKRALKPENNRLHVKDRSAHDWYRFVLSFPPHLVREYIERFRLHQESTVLDPFCGTGTTVVECKKLGIPSVGIEANRMAFFASQIKVDWSADPGGLLAHAQEIANRALNQLKRDGIDDISILGSGPLQVTLKSLSSEQQELLLTNSISPLPLHKTLVLLHAIRENFHERYGPYERLALAKALVTSIGNLHFGPEVGVGPAKEDAPVIASWLSVISRMADDLRHLSDKAAVPAMVHHADAREAMRVLTPASVDAVITSPPYPNEKDYTRTTRLESVLLGFIATKGELQAMKRSLMRSNTRNTYKGDDDDAWITGHTEIQRIAQEIETRRIALGKTSGFERLYARITKLYFGGMARHLADLRQALKPGAQLAYVVGDQASYFRVMIRTGQLLADIAQSLGYEVTGIDLFRTRLATVTKEQLREEVVVLRWPGEPGKQNSAA